MITMMSVNREMASGALWFFMHLPVEDDGLPMPTALKACHISDLQGPMRPDIMLQH